MKSHKGTPCDGGGRAWSDVSTGQGVPRVVAATRADRQVWDRGCRRCGPAGTLIADFWPPDRAKKLVLF